MTDFPELVERLDRFSWRTESEDCDECGGTESAVVCRTCGRILESVGLGEQPIGVVTGDDVLGLINAWVAAGIDLSHLETGEPFRAWPSRLVAANVYLGGRPISEALRSGAESS